MTDEPNAEIDRLRADSSRSQNWKRWGPYLSERQWGTVREDYSATGDSWGSFPHEHARSRAYRWGEDGLLGLCDRECRLCFALALWNERDPILKERLFGLTGPEGNHGEDVKECYYYLVATPTSSYLQALYKYPQAAFPYDRLVQESRGRDRNAREFELADTGIFDNQRYFDVRAEYAKAGPDDVLIRITVANRGPGAARLHVLPTLWFRNTWVWGRQQEEYGPRPHLSAVDADTVETDHPTLGRFRLRVGPTPDGKPPELLFTDNDTNAALLFRAPPTPGFFKDAFHRRVVHGETAAVNPDRSGTKAAAWYVLDLPPGAEITIRLRLAAEGVAVGDSFADFDAIFGQREREAALFYERRRPPDVPEAEAAVARQAYAGLLWSKQFFGYNVANWIDGDPSQPPPPAGHKTGRNRDWRHLHARDVISMPDKWEYPWFAAWDLAFHMIPMASIDQTFAKQQLVLFLREWYMHPNGQLPAYEFGFDDVNPPVHAWSCWRVYKISGPRGSRDRLFLSRVFHKLLINFTWWVNRKDVHGRNLFSGGFLGMDNVSLFDRSQVLPPGVFLEQADGTAWMAFFCTTMLAMALELSRHDPAYEDVASKFFEHFVAIADAMNTQGGTGLWDEQDGFYYDRIEIHGRSVPIKVRSMVGLVPLFAAVILEDELLERTPGFRQRLQWFLDNRQDLARSISYMEPGGPAGHGHRLLAIPSRQRLERVFRYLFDENEFLSPYGVRSLSKTYRDRPYAEHYAGVEHRVDYEPGESRSGMFGGNSNWRGPIWFPVNYLLIEALERYHHFYGDDYRVEYPTGSGRMLTLLQIAEDLGDRLVRLFLPDEHGRRPCHGGDRRYADDPHWRDLILFYEYFDGEDGRGLGASHQTGWTALVARLIRERHSR